jgi:radical SAM protein with 4Fe4S-binding SPASM domain
MNSLVKWKENIRDAVNIKYKHIFENSFSYHIRKDREARDLVVNTINRFYKDNIFCIQAPIWVGYKITNKCNLNCIHCWANNSNYQPSKEEIFTAIDKLINLQIYFIGLSGGELFIREDIFEVLAYIKSRGMYVELFTNAILLDEEKINVLESILDKRFDIIQVSLDGSNKEVFEKQRKTIFFDRVINNIKVLKQKGFKVRISYVATHENVYDIFNTYKLISNIGVEGFSISPVYPKNKGKEIHKLLNMNIYYDELFKCIQYNSDVELVYFLQIDFFEKIYQLVENIQLPYRIPYRITTGYISIYINANGNIYPEFELEYEEFYLGNIYYDSWEDILLKIKSNELLRAGRNLTNTKCEKCKFMSICLGHSYEQAYEIYGDFNKPNPYCKLREEYHE